MSFPVCTDWPDSTLKSVAPSDQTSLWASTFFDMPSACSGGMNDGVPNTFCAASAV